MNEILDARAESGRTKFERVFVALPIPAPTSVALAALIDDRLGKFRWNHPDQFHLTLRFVGEVDEALRNAIDAKLQQIVVEPFILPVEGLSVFPQRGQPQVVFAAVGRAHTRLFQLQHRVEEALAGLGLPLELRAFSPHITLARTSRCSPGMVNEFVKRHRDFSAPPWKVEKFCLYKTQITHFGSQYLPVGDYALRPKQAKVG